MQVIRCRLWWGWWERFGWWWGIVGNGHIIVWFGHVGTSVPHMCVIDVNHTQVVQSVVHWNVIAVHHALSFRNRTFVPAPDEILQENVAWMCLTISKIRIGKHHCTRALFAHFESSLKTIEQNWYRCSIPIKASVLTSNVYSRARIMSCSSTSVYLSYQLQFCINSLSNIQIHRNVTFPAEWPKRTMPSLTPTGHSSWPDSDVEMVDLACMSDDGLDDEQGDDVSRNL